MNSGVVFSLNAAEGEAAKKRKRRKDQSFDLLRAIEFIHPAGEANLVRAFS